MSLGDVYKSRKKLLAQNLQSKGVNASSNEGLTTLINKVLDTPVAVTGIELDTSIALSKDINSPKTHDDVIITAVLKGDYNDESAADIDLSGYLKGANITFKEGNTVLGYATTNANGTATYTISDITAGTHTFSAIFNGENTDYDTCSETINVVAEDDYHLVFGEEGYTATNKAVTVTCLLTNNEVPVSGETVTFTDSNNSTYTATTNSNGIATLNLTNISGNMTLTASYASISTVCAIFGILFHDNCSSDNTSQYTELFRTRNSSLNASLTYDSTENAYTFLGSGGDNFAGLVIPDIRGMDNIRIRCKVKFKNSNAYNQFLITMSDSLFMSDINGDYEYIRVWGTGHIDYLQKNSTKYETNISNSYTTQNYCYIELIKQGTQTIGNVYDNDMNLLSSTSQTCLNYTNPYFIIGLNTNYSGAEYGKFIKEIIVEPLNTSFKTPSSLLFEDKATEGNVNTNYIKTNSGINVVTDSNGTTISDSHSGDDYYIVNTLIQGDFHVEFYVVDFNQYGDCAFLNSSNQRQFHYALQADGSSTDGQYFYPLSGYTKISSHVPIGETVVLERIGSILYIYSNNTLISMQPVPTVDGYIAWKTHSHSNRSITFKNLKIWSLEEREDIIFNPTLDGTDNMSEWGSNSHSISFSNHIVTGRNYQFDETWDNTKNWTLSYDIQAGFNTGIEIVEASQTTQDTKCIQILQDNNTFLNYMPISSTTNAQNYGTSSQSNYIHIDVVKQSNQYRVYINNQLFTNFSKTDDWENVRLVLYSWHNSNTLNLKNISVLQ